jgi:transposase
MQTPSVVLNIGADVAKDEIVVACSEGSFPVRKVANHRTALLAFLKGLPAGSCIGVESTGSYHELFADAAHKLGFLVFLLNPKDTRHYAKAVGLGGKTDRVDAELIARIDLRVKALVEASPDRKQNFTRLCTITGRPGRRHRSGQHPRACAGEERGCFCRLHRPGPATG